MHWFDELLDEVASFVKGREPVVVNGGLSVSGLQHVGRLRGEITLAHALARALREEGHHTWQNLILYTQDEWKGKPDQLAQFSGDTGKEFIGRRQIDVPDPLGCHANWTEHFWQDFGGVLDRFAPRVMVETTTDAYRKPAMKALVRDLAGRAEEVRALVNKYRARHPYPSGWIPYEAYCNACHRIGATTLSIEADRVRYRCDRCGAEGESSIELGKLNWRLEWPALWKVFGVAVEPFGKDHATPGGSRDSCKDIAEHIMGFEPPFGIPYEWVGVESHGRDLGDMGSSDFLGFTPKDWLRVGDPEVLRFVYTSVPRFRRVALDLWRTDVYHDNYDAAERTYFSAKEDEDLARSYELAQVGTPPVAAPYRVPYRHAAFLSQISPEAGRVEWCVRRLRDTGVLARDLAPAETAALARRIDQARTWVERHAPENKVVLLERLTDEVRSSLTAADRASLARYAERAAVGPWREEEIKATMVSLTSSGALPVDTPQFFRNVYLVLLGTATGPRAAPFLAVLDRQFVLGRLLEAATGRPVLSPDS